MGLSPTLMAGRLYAMQDKARIAARLAHELIVLHPNYQAILQKQERAISVAATDYKTEVAYLCSVPSNKRLRPRPALQKKLCSLKFW